MFELLYLILNVLWAAMAIALVVAAGRIYQYREELPQTSAERKFPMLSIIIPARNEAANIGECLQCITHLDYPEGALEIIVVDLELALGAHVVLVAKVTEMDQHTTLA